MIIDPSTFIEITINNKKFLMDPEILPKLVTYNVDNNFADIHSYTVGDNPSNDDLLAMVRLLNKFDPKAPVAIQQLLLEFMDKYYRDPIEEILRLINNTNVTRIFKYFMHGPFDSTFDNELLATAGKLAIKSLDDSRLPSYINVYCHYIIFIRIIDDTVDKIHLAIPTSFILNIQKHSEEKNYDIINFFRANVWRILSVMTLHDVYMFEEICGTEFAKKIFAYVNFDLMSWTLPEIIKPVQNSINKSIEKPMVSDDESDNDND